MGAQPKNKISRAERGKRRAGNTPSLKKDAKKTSIPLHKQTLMKKFARAIAPASASAPAQNKKATPSKTAPTTKTTPVAKTKPAAKTKKTNSKK